jgi:hypothetical protein
MTKFLVGCVLRLPALASAGCGLENLHIGYRRFGKLLEGFFQKICHHPATAEENQAPACSLLNTVSYTRGIS